MKEGEIAVQTSKGLLKEVGLGVGTVWSWGAEEVWWE